MDSPTQCCPRKKNPVIDDQIYDQPQLYFPTNLFTQGKYSPTLYFNVSTREVNPDCIRRHKLFAPLDDNEPNAPARMTIHCVPYRLSMNLIARYIRARLELFDLQHTITSDAMTYFDINASITDPALDPRQPYMVNHKTPAQIVVQGTQHVVWILHSDIGSFLTCQLHGHTGIFFTRMPCGSIFSICVLSLILVM